MSWLMEFSRESWTSSWLWYDVSQFCSCLPASRFADHVKTSVPCIPSVHGDDMNYRLPPSKRLDNHVF